MGRNFSIELQELEATYKWAMRAPIEPLTAAISSSAPYSLVSVGSGGSFTAAHLASALHQKYTGKVSKPMTPLEFVSSRFDTRSIAMMVLSASGSNKDIISAAEYAAVREPRRCIFFCLRKGSALSRVSNSFNLVDHIALSPPSAKDGFLSTNSLLAFSTLLIRTYDAVFSSDCSLPKDFHKLLPNQHLRRDSIAELMTNCEPLWKRDTLIVLYGPSVASAALDIESKFTEAALGNVQLADFRNFAHGRHHWLAKRESSASILALYAHEERKLAQRTLNLIPPGVPRCELCIPFAGPIAMLSSLIIVLYLVGSAGKYRGIDPGRPGVPVFGRRIYSLRNPYDFKNKISMEQVAIARKLGCDARDVTARKDVRLWQGAYARFVEDLQAATFSGLILDYDGTLCDERDRFKGLSKDVVSPLIRFLRKGILIGVATGRGKSVKKDLRKHIPMNLWDKVYIGYYNGSVLAELGNEDVPESSAPSTGLLKRITTDMSNHPILANLARWKPRKTQISIYPVSTAFADTIWRIVQQLSATYGLKIVRSSHSIDIVQKRTSKRSLLTHIRTLAGKDARILLIGDKGQWPGNDYELLSTSSSLSVDEVSSDPDTCWNLAPPGHRGVQATIGYLNAFKVVDGLATLNGKTDFWDERSHRAINEKRTRTTSPTNNLA